MKRIYHILPCVITTGYHDIYLNTHMMAKDFAYVYICIYSLLMVTPGMHALGASPRCALGFDEPPRSVDARTVPSHELHRTFSTAQWP
jgi:hypothetical protein